MASLLQKLARNQSTTRLITTFKTPILSHPPFFNHLSQPNPTQLVPVNSPIPTQPNTEDPFSHQSLHFYPSFSFGCFLNPISLSGLLQSGNQEEAVSDDSASSEEDLDLGGKGKNETKNTRRTRRKSPFVSFSFPIFPSNINSGTQQNTPK
ncbi:hypothetical protein POM88_021612 [Heracleum sosnowskyi]|uniref:Uncharacterized protein n=1 Tax=Heracleum sosnowskyi TaxID=360622 RepID=A0AAD8IG58_9APIA|nr:hypothetical protein POM88_021612 [Heracleum sosnowskyi]